MYANRERMPRTITAEESSRNRRITEAILCAAPLCAMLGRNKAPWQSVVSSKKTCDLVDTEDFFHSSEGEAGMRFNTDARYIDCQQVTPPIALSNRIFALG